MKFKTPQTIVATLQQITRIRRDALLVMWTLVVLLLPFYVFDSGVPQPADWIALLLLPMLLRTWNGRLPGPLIRPLKSLVLFMVYVFLVNIVWSFVIFSFSINAKNGFLMAPTYYLFNALLFFTFLLMFQRYGEFLLWLTVRLVLAAVFLQVLVSAVGRASHGRSTGMFNNPNQLGYYALLSACLILFGQKRFKISTVLVTAGLAACSYLALLSASKAALASICGLGAVLLISKLRTIVLAGIVFSVLIFTSNPFSRAIDRAQDRIENDESYGFFEERGYDRIVAFPEYWMFGAGEGYYNRFKEVSAIGAHELHSSTATLFFCYGIAGVTLFGLFMWGVMAGAGLRSWIIVGAGFAYGMTHQGLRFRLLWLLLAMVCSLRELETRDRLARLARRLAPGRPA
jgi:O-antigen ligase